MIDDSLVMELAAAARANSGITLLTADASERLLVRVAARFRVDTRRLWWWEGTPNARTVPFSEASEVDQLRELLSGQAGQLTLVVTDDESPPWVALEGTLSALVLLLEETRHFEFFIVDRDLNWIVFDTHHCEFVVAGDLGGGNARSRRG